MEAAIWLIPSFVSVFLFFVKLINSTKISSTTRKVLPGPVSIPFLGGIPHLLSKISISEIIRLSSSDVCAKLKNIWGIVFQVQIASHTIVIIDDLLLAKKVLSSEDWSDRVPDAINWIYERSFNSHNGLLTTNGSAWKEIRRFVIRNLTKYGFGRSATLEIQLNDEIQNFFTHLDNKINENENVVDMQGLFHVSTLNLLWEMVASKRYDYNSPEILNQIKLFEEFSSIVRLKEAGIFIFPWLRHFKFASSYSRLISINQKMQQDFARLIAEKKAIGNHTRIQENLLDEFLCKMEDKDVNVNYYNEEQLTQVLVDLFITGFVPVSSCLEFCILYLILNPDVQKKCQFEIDAVVGKSRNPSINDHERLPYTQSVILEVLRKSPLLPLTLRIACRDTMINECHVSKGTVLIVNIDSIQNDPKTWKNPNKFVPERFLDDTETTLRNTDLIIPFGLGSRSCPAQVFAKTSCMAYITYLLHRYTFELLLIIHCQIQNRKWALEVIHNNFVQLSNVAKYIVVKQQKYSYYMPMHKIKCKKGFKNISDILYTRANSYRKQQN